MTTALVAAILLFGLFRWVLHQTVAHHLETAARRIPGCTGVVYDNLVLPYFALQCTVEEIALRFADPEDTIAVRRLHIRDFRPGKELPRRLDALACGVELGADHPLTASWESRLRSLGYRELKGDVALRWTRGGTQGENWTVDCSVRVADAGETTLSLHADKVNPQGLAAALENPVNWLLVLPPVQLVAAAWHFEDRGLLARALAVEARRRGGHPGNVREDLRRGLTARAQTASGPAERAFWNTWADFLHRPRCIVFQSKPAQPLPLGRLLWMRRPADVIHELDLVGRTAGASTCGSGRGGQALSDQCQSTPASSR